MKKKVLVVYATGGMGHVTAAQATTKAFEAKYPEVEVKTVDVLDYANFFYKKIFVDGYNWVSARRPDLWGRLYRKFNNKAKQKFPTLISRWAIEKRFIKFVKEFKPDFIVSTHPLPMILISHSKEQNVVDIYSSMVVTDFGCHSFWVDEEVNYYFVATEDVKMCLQGYGVDPDKVIVTGIPIQLKFSKKINKAAVVKKLNLNPDQKTVLIVGGQFSFETLQQIISGINAKHKDDVQFLVVAGRDHVLKQDLENSDLDKDHNIKVFGFVDNMEEMMTAADLIFSKAGGLTVSESLAKGLPLVIYKVIPGQEEDNVEYLTTKGAAVKVDDVAGIVGSVNELIANLEKLNKMQKVAAYIGRPNSATHLADFVVDKIS